MPSVVADIGHIIETHLKTLDMLPASEIDTHQQAYIQQKRDAASDNASDKSGFPSSASRCNKCNQKSVVLLDGCATCLNCGDSKCG